MDPTLLLIVGGLGLLVCLALLFFGVNMLRDERKAKAATAEPATAKAPADGPHPLPLPPLKTATGEGESQAIDAPGSNLPLRESSPAASALTGGMARLTAGVMARMPHAAATGSAHEV